MTDKRRGFPHSNKPKKPDVAIYKPPVNSEHFDDADEELESEGNKTDGLYLNPSNFMLDFSWHKDLLCLNFLLFISLPCSFEF